MAHNPSKYSRIYRNHQGEKCGIGKRQFCEDKRNRKPSNFGGGGKVTSNGKKGKDMKRAKENKHLIFIGDKAFKALQKVKYKRLIENKHPTTWETASNLILIGAGKLDPDPLKEDF